MLGDAMKSGRACRAALAGRLRFIREDRFGDCGVPKLARMLGLPERTWLNYEGGVLIPGEVLLRFLDATSAEPRWLLTGHGPRYRDRPAMPRPH